MNLKTNIILFFLAVSSFSYAQMSEYRYTRELLGITDQWHTIALPDEIFGKIAPDLSDLRIYGIAENKDTLEAPYLLRIRKESISVNEATFSLLNSSQNEKGYFFTFEVPSSEPINQLYLQFKEKNFDWKIRLEGSHDQQEWFTITDDYRIVSLKNELTDYRFTTVSFPASSYRYMRLLVKSDGKPGLLEARLFDYETIEGHYRAYTPEEVEINHDKINKTTEIDIRLPMAVPVNFVKVNVEDDIDYYRPIAIRYLADSLYSQEGWKYFYNTLASGTLSSLEDGVFFMEGPFSKQLKIVIQNYDNQPLSIKGVEVKGYSIEMVGRFTEPATYFLAYGNERVYRPQYDIARFIDKIPDSPPVLTLGKERVLSGEEEQPAIHPLFANKAWLWVVMVVIIGLLGWFSFRMMGKAG